MAQLKLSLLAAFDDLQRSTNSLTTAKCETEFLKFIAAHEDMRRQWLEAVTECRRLQQALDESHRSSAGLVGKLTHARKLLDQERKSRKIAELDREATERQMAMVRDILFADHRNKLHDETKEKLAFLNTTGNRNSRGVANPSLADRLDTIAELDSTGSLLSDLSYSRSDDDLDAVDQHKEKPWKKSMPSHEEFAPSPKRRRSSIRKSIEMRKGDSNDHVVATTTVTVRKEGNITAHSRIEAMPSGKCTPLPDLFPSAPPISSITDSGNSDSSSSNNKWATPKPKQGMSTLAPPSSATRSTLDSSPSYGMSRKNMNLRPHTFVHKTAICPEPCNYCGKRLKFGKLHSKCQECRALCHQECEGLLPVPCVSIGNTHAVKGYMGTIADYTPMTSPMVPAIVVHCIREIESRGLNEVGIYRVPGSERDVKALKENFLKGKGAPNLSNVDVHVICGAIKDFLRSLREPLILRTYWHDFVRATELPDPEDAQAALYQAISELPQPNRDTLAALILHLQHVAECPECKMPVSNLSKIFGPTIVGYSTSDPVPEVLLSETKKQAAVVDNLMRLPSDYWANFAHPSGSENREPDFLPHTPSTTSLLNGAKNFLGNTPRSLRGKRKFFATPPAAK